MSAAESSDIKQKFKEPEFRGPVSQRKCRDVFFYVLFLAFWVGMGLVALWSWQNGLPYRLIYPSDKYGNLCGYDNTKGKTAGTLNMQNKRYGFFLSPSSNKTNVICLAACPTSNTTYAYNSAICTSTSSSTCNGTYGVCAYNSTGGEDSNACYPVYNTEVVTGVKFCVATEDSLTSSVSTFIADYNQGLKVIVRDVSNHWEAIVASFGIALGLSVIWLVIIRYFTTVVVWLTVILVFLSLVAITLVFWVKAGYIKVNFGSSAASTAIQSASSRNAWMFAAAITMTVITAIVLLLILVLARRIMIAVGIIKEAAKATGAVPSIFLFTLFMFFWFVALAVYWIVVFTYLASSGDWNSSSLTYRPTSKAIGLIAYHVFGLYWTVCFLDAVEQTTVAGAIASWYFSKKKEDMPSWPVLGSFNRVLAYHQGSMALGALIVAMVKMIRAVLRWIQHKMHKAGGLCRFVCCCCIFCVSCFERFLQYIDRNAYIYIAIHGDSFCDAAEKVFGLLLRNVERVAAITSVSDALLGLAKLAVCAGTVFASAFIINKDDPLSSSLSVLTIVAILSYTTAAVFMNVFHRAIDTIFICFCEDCERNDGSPEKPYYMSDDLKLYIESQAHK